MRYGCLISNWQLLLFCNHVNNKVLSGIKLIKNTCFYLKGLQFYFSSNKKKKNKKKNITKIVNVPKPDKPYAKKLIKNFKKYYTVSNFFQIIKRVYFRKLRCWNRLRLVYKLNLLRKSKLYRWVNFIKSRRNLYIHCGVFGWISYYLPKRLNFKLKKLKGLKLKLRKLKHHKILKRMRFMKRWGGYFYRFVTVSNRKLLNYGGIAVKRRIHRFIILRVKKKLKKKKKLRVLLPIIVNCLIYNQTRSERLTLRKRLKSKKFKKRFFNYFKVKKININYLNVKHSRYIPNKNILNYIFINEYSVKSFYINFYTQTKLDNIKKPKKKKNLKKKTYLFNIWKNRLTSYKKARQVHWNFFKKGTLKKRRYKNFLYFFLRNTEKYIDNILLFFVIRFKLSYIFWSNFTKMYLYFFQKKLMYKCIYQLPISLLFWSYINLHLTNKKKIKKKIKKWIFVKTKTKRTFWMNRKKKIPKFFRKQIFNNKWIGNCIQYDFLTNYFVILKSRDSVICNESVVFDNKLLKLHDFRYKA